MAYNVKFLRGTAQAYANLLTKDSMTFYYTTDTNQLYIGNVKLSDNEEIAAAVARIATNEEAIADLREDINALIGGEGGGSIQDMIDASIAESEEKTNGLITGLEGRVATIEGDYLKKADKDEVAAAAKAAQDAADAAQGEIDALEEKVGTVPADKTVVQMIADAQEAATYDDTALAARVTKNEQDLATLNGEGEGSVKKTVDDALNKFATDVSNDEVVNTFKELVDYVADHGPEAAEMAGAIAANTASISALDAKVGTLPEGATVTNVVAYVDQQVAAVDFSDEIATAKQEAIDTAAGDATSKANTAEQNAKNYADGLASNYATAEQGAKADTAVQSVVAGDNNGTIKVDGTEVKVTGLGTAAYAAAGDFDAAGSASTAEANAKAYTDTALTWGEIA